MFSRWLRSPVLRISCRSEIIFALLCSAVWLLLYNLEFWHQTLAAMWHPAVGSAVFLVSLAVLVVSVQAILLLLAPTQKSMRIFASALFVIAAIASYFTTTYGALLNKDMLRNVAQTDPAEVGDLLSGNLILRVLILGVIPALLVWKVDLPEVDWKRRLRHRAVFMVGALAISVAGVFAASADYAVFLREHKPIRYTVVPLMPVASATSLAAETWKHRHGDRLIDLSGPVQRTTVAGVGVGASTKPLVLFVVIGETARAANFQLGGYARPTNPRLSAIEDVTYFNRVSSCGTSTAISVPCLFSHFGRAEYGAQDARGYTNLLDSLVKAGFDVQWRDNNAGCKGVCARVPSTDYAASPANQAHCQNSHCYDEVMLTDLAEKLRTLTRDTVIVFHQIGSHGPAYSERYPQPFEVFKPSCHSNQLQRCTQEQIVNTYDNTIVYTDYVLARQIELLRAAEDRVDSMLLYVSDHGESLGEQGIYLHGMPYSFAPRTQKEVPMLMWTSRGYINRTRLNPQCVRAEANQELSHDNVYHTVLGAAQTKNALYRPELDLVSKCQNTTQASRATDIPRPSL